MSLGILQTGKLVGISRVFTTISGTMTARPHRFCTTRTAIGKTVPAIAATCKPGVHLHVDRRNGSQIFPVKEVPGPQPRESAACYFVADRTRDQRWIGEPDRSLPNDGPGVIAELVASRHRRGRRTSRRVPTQCRTRDSTAGLRVDDERWRGLLADELQSSDR